MTPLRAKYIRDLTIRGRARRTQRAYTRYVSEPALYYQRSPELIAYEEVTNWLYHLTYGGYNSYSFSRQGLLGSASGSAIGGEFSTWTESGYQFHLGNFTVGPMAALEYTLVDVNGFNESGSLLPLRVHSDQEASLRTDVGLKASYTWQIGNISVLPTLLAAWEHEYFYSALPITVSTPEFPGNVKLFGPDEGRNSAIVNAGAAIQWTPQISTYIGYQGQLGRNNYTSNTVTGGISFSF